MKRTREGILLALICLIPIAASVWGIIAAFTTHIALNIDGIMLVGVCLMMVGIFALMLYLLAREQGWLPARKKQNAKQDAAAPAPAPSKSSPQAAK